MMREGDSKPIVAVCSLWPKPQFLPDRSTTGYNTMLCRASVQVVKNLKSCKILFLVESIDVVDEPIDIILCGVIPKGNVDLMWR